jgi:hypothetical protein
MHMLASVVAWTGMISPAVSGLLIVDSRPSPGRPSSMERAPR